MTYSISDAPKARSENVDPPVLLYNELNKAWKSTCRIVLGGEVGGLTDCGEWLREYLPRRGRRISHLSGKEVLLTADDYCEKANVISLDEKRESALDPLSINDIKDIDSIARAVSGKWEYSGNKVLGASTNVELSDLVTDSSNIMDCTDIQAVSYGFSVYDVQESKYVFGGGQFDKSEFMVGFLGGNNLNRCFASTVCADSSDLYLSHNCYGCHEMMFSLNQINKSHCIGNVELEKEKYLQTKKKLLGEIRDEIRNKGRFPSLFDLIKDNKLSKDVTVSLGKEERPTDMSLIEKSFSSTFKILFKKEPGSIVDYNTWLAKRVVSTSPVKTPFGSEVYVPTQKARFRWGELLPRHRVVTYPESLELSKLGISEVKTDDLGELKNWISDTACICVDFTSGKSRNIIRSSITRDCINVYRGYINIKAENVGVCSWPLYSKHVFGCHSVKNSQFSVKCYSSLALNRCFEVDASVRCSDTYFAHNCEGLQDAMFCWNVKGKRHAIGNASLEPATYRKLKDALIGQMADEITSNKELRFDIYNIGCGAT